MSEEEVVKKKDEPERVVLCDALLPSGRRCPEPVRRWSSTGPPETRVFACDAHGGPARGGGSPRPENDPLRDGRTIEWDLLRERLTGAASAEREIEEALRPSGRFVVYSIDSVSLNGEFSIVDLEEIVRILKKHGGGKEGRGK